MSVRVQLIAADLPLRESLRTLLDRESDMVVVCEAGDAHSARIGVAATRPDVVLLDAELDGDDGALGVLRGLKAETPRTRVVVLAGRPSEESAIAALSAGASGYAGKLQPMRELVGAIRAVGAGGSYLCPNLVASTAAPAPGLRVPTPRRG